MVKSVLGVNHQGLREWALQRLTALIMAIYTIGLICYFVLHSDLSFLEWHYLFTHQWMKVFTALFILAMLYHAWVGMWTIFTDYVKPFVLRLILQVLVLIFLVAAFIWGIMILWSV